MCFSLSLKVKMITSLHVCCMHGYTGCEALRGEMWRCLNSLYSVLSSVRNQQHMSFVPWLTTRTFCLQRVQDCQPELKKKEKRMIWGGTDVSVRKHCYEMPQKPSDFLTIFFYSDPAPAAHEMSGEDACADAVWPGQLRRPADKDSEGGRLWENYTQPNSSASIYNNEPPCWHIWQQLLVRVWLDAVCIISVPVGEVVWLSDALSFSVKMSMELMSICQTSIRGNATLWTQSSKEKKKGLCQRVATGRCETASLYYII